jgi:hypothetical protein
MRIVLVCVLAACAKKEPCEIFVDKLTAAGHPPINRAADIARCRDALAAHGEGAVFTCVLAADDDEAVRRCDKAVVPTVAP